MDLTTRIRLALAKRAGVNLAEYKSGDIVFYVEDDELKEGVKIFVMDNKDAYVLPEDGVYPIDEQNVTIENGIVVKIEPITADPAPAGILKTKLTKLADDAEVTVADYNELVDVLNIVIKVVEELGGNVEENAEELKLSKAEAAAAKTEAAAAKIETAAVKAKLDLAMQKSNREFAKPNPSQKQDGEKSTHKELMAKFNL